MRRSSPRSPKSDRAEFSRNLPAQRLMRAFLKAIQQEKITPEDAVLVLNTGSGLKDVKAAMQAVHQAPVIEPSLSAVKKTLKM